MPISASPSAHGAQGPFRLVRALLRDDEDLRAQGTFGAQLLQHLRAFARSCAADDELQHGDPSPFQFLCIIIPYFERQKKDTEQEILPGVGDYGNKKSS